MGTPWGSQHDYDRAQVREYFVDATDHLLGELRLDGFRMDAVMAMVDGGWTSQWASGQSIARRARRTSIHPPHDLHPLQVACQPRRLELPRLLK